VGRAFPCRGGEPFDFAELTTVAAAGIRWNAVDAAVTTALRAAEKYPLARHLGLRLVAWPAHRDGWGEPVTWLRQAENYFHRSAMPAAAGACRATLRRIGVPAPQHPAEANRIPAWLRERGVTVREYEVFELLLLRLANKETAVRLCLSPRTVEKHVASLLAKTEPGNRVSLIATAARLTHD
jgi:DNA-binding CsgD family transcriptional regulator